MSLSNGGSGFSAEENKSLSPRCQLVASGTRRKLWRVRPSDIFHLVSEGTNIVPTFEAATSSTLSARKVPLPIDIHYLLIDGAANVRQG